MKDALGQEINVGDKVIACGGNYSDAIICVVLRITRVNCTIAAPLNWDKTTTTRSSRHPSTLVVVTSNLRKLAMDKAIADSNWGEPRTER